MTDKLDLASFFPYRLAELQQAISNSVAQVYAGRFNLTRQQWRVLAVLGDGVHKSAKTICGLTNLDKMQTSRAIAKMLENGLLSKVTDEKDKRSALLSLSDKGVVLYRNIEPLVLAREQQLLSVLSKSEQQQLSSLMAKLLDRTHRL